MVDFMNKAPKKIWMSTDAHAWAMKDVIFNVPYIRADLVDELVSLLREWNNATAEEDKDWFDYESRVNAALEALEGE
jgi:hypothetical protein